MNKNLERFLLLQNIEKQKNGKEDYTYKVIMQNEVLACEILDALSSIGLNSYSLNCPDLYLLPKGGKIAPSITHWGYRKMAKKEGVVMDTYHVTQKMVEDKYFIGYNPMEKKACFDSERWHPDFTGQANKVDELYGIIVTVNFLKENITHQFLFKKEFIDEYRPSDVSAKSQWNDNGFNGLCMYDKSVLRHIAKRYSFIPEFVFSYEENYDEYMSDGANFAIEIAEKVGNCETTKELESVFKSEDMKKFRNNKAIIALFSERKKEILEKEGK